MNLVPKNEDETRATRPETLQRIMQVQQWMVSGLPSTENVKAGMQQWTIGKSMMYNYIADAYQQFKETADTERANRRQFHIEIRMKLFHDIMQQQQPGYQFAALQVLKDV